MSQGQLGMGGAGGRGWTGGTAQSEEEAAKLVRFWRALRGARGAPTTPAQRHAAAIHPRAPSASGSAAWRPSPHRVPLASFAVTRGGALVSWASPATDAFVPPPPLHADARRPHPYRPSSRSAWTPATRSRCRCSRRWCVPRQATGRQHWADSGLFSPCVLRRSSAADSRSPHSRSVITPKSSRRRGASRTRGA